MERRLQATASVEAIAHAPLIASCMTMSTTVLSAWRSSAVVTSSSSKEADETRRLGKAGAIELSKRGRKLLRRLRRIVIPFAVVRRNEFKFIGPYSKFLY